MSNKLRKTITCAFCEKTVKNTVDCKELYGRDVCPDCVKQLVKVVNKLSVEEEEVGSNA